MLNDMEDKFWMLGGYMMDEEDMLDVADNIWWMICVECCGDVCLMLQRIHC